MPKYPEIEVVLYLDGPGGNAFAVLGAVQKAMRRGGIAKEERDVFLDEATAGDYDYLLDTCYEWVAVL